MRTRNHDWLNPKTLEVLYGVQVQVEGDWMNAMLDGKPILCKTQGERAAARKAIQINARKAVKKAKAMK